jgi:wyosine [tRNA(Phe)-imidazoG37] synthetase (radical SAM superfamily)
MRSQYVFGPVASRRLGISLGIDLVPSKTCSLNCVYCEAGETDALLLERKEYVPIDEVLVQLEQVLESKIRIDYLTFSGAGEPTLNSGLGRVVDFIKSRYPQYPVCLLTNGTLLGDPQLQREIEKIDLVIPSLDASSQDEFDKINRPVQGLSFDSFCRGLFEYSKKRTSKIWLELFIVPDVNDSDESIARFVDIVKAINPEKVQLNTLDRPGCVEWIKPSSRENTLRFVRALEPFVPVEAVGPFKYKSSALRTDVSLEKIDQQIIDLLGRRPCTIDDLRVALGGEEKAIKAHLDTLLSSGRIQSERQARGDFFSLA